MPDRADGNINRGNADGGGRGAVDSLVEQVLRYLAGDTTPEGVVALGERLRNERGAPDLFVRLCLLDSRLCEKYAPGRREFMSEMLLDESEDRRGASSVDAMVMPAITSRADEEPQTEPITLPSYPAPVPPSVAWWQRRATWAIAAGVLLAVGVLAVVLMMSSPETHVPVVVVKPTEVEEPRDVREEVPVPAPVEVPEPQRPVVVATLVALQDARWAGVETPAAGSALLSATELNLYSGLARITFRSGVKVVVEGPARFTPDAEGRLTLSTGRLTALVTSDAGKGFTVDTPAAQVVDLGTEFGVDVPTTQGAAVEVQVFDGLVTLAPAPAKATTAPTTGQTTPPTPQLVRAGAGARIDPSGAVTPVPANPAPFVRNAEADARERAKEGSSFDRWAAYRFALARDRDVVAYYPFDAANKDKSPDALANVSVAGAALDGTLTGDGGVKPAWVEGRWPQKAALQFSEQGVPRVVFAAAAEAAFDFSQGGGAGSRPFTIAVWVKAKPVPAPGVGIISRGPEGVSQWNVGTESSFYRFGVRAAAQSKLSLIHTRNHVSQRWHHVAAVYDPDAGTKRIYVDGALTPEDVPGASKAPKELIGGAGAVVLGCRVDTLGKFVSPLVGTVDELVIMSRAINAEEAKRMYEAGKPD